jgi:hypothetical protein
MIRRPLPVHASHVFTGYAAEHIRYVVSHQLSQPPPFFCACKKDGSTQKLFGMPSLYLSYLSFLKPRYGIIPPPMGYTGSCVDSIERRNAPLCGRAGVLRVDRGRGLMLQSVGFGMICNVRQDAFHTPVATIRKYSKFLNSLGWHGIDRAIPCTLLQKETTLPGRGMCLVNFTFADIPHRLSIAGLQLNSLFDPGTTVRALSGKSPDSRVGAVFAASHRLPSHAPATGYAVAAADAACPAY